MSFVMSLGLLNEGTQGVEDSDNLTDGDKSGKSQKDTNTMQVPKS